MKHLRKPHLSLAITGIVLALVGATLSVWIATAAAGRTHGSGPQARAIDDLAAIEQARLKALVDADTTAAGKFIADDFVLVNPAGATLNRADYLDAVKAGFIDYLVFEPVSPITVDRFGHAAVLRFQVSFDLHVAGLRLTHGGWITELYQRRNGRWQIVSEQATPIPNNFDLFLESLKPPA
jgi:hypothetical protein